MLKKTKPKQLGLVLLWLIFISYTQTLLVQLRFDFNFITLTYLKLIGGLFMLFLCPPLFGQTPSIDSLPQLPETASIKEKVLLKKEVNPGGFIGYPFKGAYFHKKEDAQTKAFSMNPITQYDLYIDLNGTASIEKILAQQDTLPWNNAIEIKHQKNTVYWMRTRFYGSPYFNGEQILNFSTLTGKDIFTSHLIVAIELSLINLAIWMECSIVAMLILLSLSITLRSDFPARPDFSGLSLPKLSFLKFNLLLFVILGALPLLAQDVQNTVQVISGQETQEITGKMTLLENSIEVFKDEKGKTTFEEVAANDALFGDNNTKGNFQPDKVYWMKLNLQAGKNYRDTCLFYVEGGTSFLSWEKIDAYLIREDGRVEQQKTGYGLARENKSIPIPRQVLGFGLDSTENARLYIRVEGEIAGRDPELLSIWAKQTKELYPFFQHEYQFKGEFREDVRNSPFRCNNIRDIHLLEAPDSRTTFEDLLAHQENWKWDDNQSNILPKKDKVYWIKKQFIGTNMFDGEQILHVSRSGYDGLAFDYVDVYTSKNKEAYIHQRTGNAVPLSERPYDFWATFFKIDLQAGDTLDLYIRLEGLHQYFPMQVIQLNHIDPSSVFPRQVNEAAKKWLLLGILGSQFAFFLCLFFIERERIHFYFSIFILGVLLNFAFSEINFSFYVPFPDWDKHYVDIFNAGIYLAGIGFLKFTETYFNYATDSIYSKKIIPSTIFLTIICWCCIWLSTPLDFFHELPLGWLIIIFTILLSIWLAIKAKKQPPLLKLIWFIAIIPMSIVAVALCISATYRMSDFLVQVFGELWPASMIFLLTVFSLSIGYRKNLLKQEKENALKQNLKDQKTIIEKLEQTTKLEKMDEVKTRFFTNITHEFRTPLTVIKGMAAQIKVDPEKLIDKGIPMIERNANNLLNLVNQLLDLSKLESREMKLANQQGNIITYVKYLVESIHSLAASKNILVHFHSEKDLIMMDFDEKKFQQVILNLLSNAIKFTPKNGHIYVSITSIADSLKGNSGSQTLQIKVRDTGRGIPENQLPFIFDRFYQVDGTTTRQGEGTGIGLALVKELVDLMKGTIVVKSKVQRETEFTIKLPIYNKAALSSQPITLPSFSPTIIDTQAARILSKNAVNEDLIIEQSDKQNILIIEDNADVVAYIALCLQPHYAVQIANNGAEGIEMALENIPDIIITDVMMPIKDGFEVCQILKADSRTSHIPIIMLTAKVDIDSKLQGLEQGADAYLSKPFHPKELLIRLEQLIANRQRLQAKYSTAQLIVEPVPKTEDVFLQSIQKIILENLEKEGFGAEELVQNLGTSRTQLYRKLKALTDMSVANYIKKIKLHEAKRLLLETDKNISEIAYAVGYTSLNYFSNSFSKAFGLSPRKFREEANLLS